MQTGADDADFRVDHATDAAFSSTPLRVLRLLALYRAVAAIALTLAAAGIQTGSLSYAFGGAYAALALCSFALIGRFRGRPSGLLLAQLVIDLLFVVSTYLDAGSAATTFAAYLYPILAAHGWFLRSRLALAHAALAAIALLLAELLLHTGGLQAVTQAALVGAGYFLVTLLGMLLGRSAAESEQRVALRSADVRRLAHINQVIINELDDGVLVVGAQGQIVMANPQATRWLGGDEASMRTGVELYELSPDLHARWQAFFVAASTLDSTPIRTRDGQRTLVPRMMPVDLEERAATLVFLEDLDQAEAQAQQIKLAALGRLSASIAHEIRNPLSAIKQAAQLIGEEVDERPEARALTRMIDKNVDRIDRIVRDVSLLGRRDRGSPGAIAVEAVVSELIDELCSTLPAPRDAFHLGASGQPTVYADRGHFEEILVNLLSNAWRHASHSTGCITVTIAAEPDMQRAVITVLDDGAGVPADIADRIFEPFYSGSGSTGLGLYLVRELALANGGSVRLGSSRKGARFVLELPLMPNP